QYTLGQRSLETNSARETRNATSKATRKRSGIPATTDVGNTGLSNTPSSKLVLIQLQAMKIRPNRIRRPGAIVSSHSRGNGGAIPAREVLLIPGLPPDIQYITGATACKLRRPHRSSRAAREPDRASTHSESTCCLSHSCSKTKAWPPSRPRNEPVDD